MSVFFSVEAEGDLEGIANYIAADSPARALSFVSEIRKHCKKIERAPIGRLVSGRFRPSSARWAVGRSN
jgi:plasmid stabilization system protein ParE